MMTNLNCRLGFLQSKMKKAAVIFMSHRPMRPATFFTRWLSRFEILCPMLVPEKLREKEMVGKKNIKDKAKGPYHGKKKPESASNTQGSKQAYVVVYGL